MTHQYTNEEIKALEDLGYEIILRDESSISISKDIEDIDIMVCSNPFRKIDIREFTNLKWIQVLTSGINHVPLEQLRDMNITLTNSRGGYSIPIAEWIVLKVLEMIKNTREFYKSQEKRQWRQDTTLLELYQKTIGFIGTGSIAQEAAKRLSGFGVEILGMNYSGGQREYFHECYTVDHLHEILPQCDVVIITAPSTSDTYHLLDDRAFSNMKDGTYIVNIARGNIIDEKALIDNLNSGKVKKAALDVFEKEPLPADSPLWTMNNVLISPHNSWASDMDRKRVYEIIYRNMKNYMEGEKLINLIDLSASY